jgi:NADH dehydrogenase FAD-containing subunit
MENTRLIRILILGGGFAGLTVAVELERSLGWDPSIETTLVNRENFFLFTPMLHEVAASDLDLTTIVNPARKMLRRVRFIAGEVDRVDIEQRGVVVSHGFDHHQHTLEFQRFRSVSGHSRTHDFTSRGRSTEPVENSSIDLLTRRAYTMRGIDGREIGPCDQEPAACAGRFVNC